MRIQALTTIEDCRSVAELERKIWGYTDAEDVVPPPVLIVSIKRGGILLGAFDDAGRMLGFVYSIPALKAGRVTQWSHMLGVVPEAREAGIGLQLKLAQRKRSLEMGIELIEWTFDPLQALNAHLNVARLGVVVEEYEENIYGDSSSPLHRGTPTDRFVAEWHLRRPHVERRIAAIGEPIVRDSGVASAPLVNASRSIKQQWLEPGDAALDLDAPRLLVEIPVGFTEMQTTAPDVALAWRLSTRRIFRTYLAREYRIVDFFLARDAGRGHYLLARP
jgi:predicted GNAT superfamily acetyltransferase